MMAHCFNDPFLLFEFKNPAGASSHYHFTEALKVLVADRPEEVRPLLENVQRAVDSDLYAAGYVSYEAASAFHPQFSVHSHYQMPLAWFGLFRAPSSEPLPDDNNGQGYTISNWQQTTNEQEYHRQFSKIEQALSNKQIEQMNYTMRLRAQFSGNDFAFYRHLAQAQQADYAAYLNLGKFRILSASPELFFHWDGKRIVVKPMKGTVERGRFLAEDDAYAAWLAQSPKNLAENEMITHLLGEELRQLATPDSVNVSERFKIERYPTVWQMTSTVEAETRPGTTLTDILTALFPSGSITGVPKADAMALITQVEQETREVYCGAIGFISPDGKAIFNTAIRTVWLDQETGVAEYSVGGAITSRSTASEEYREALTKAELLNKVSEPQADFHLLETILLEKGVFSLLSRHLQRLQSSATYFSIPLSIQQVKRELTHYAQQFPQGEHRVRLLVSQSGGISLECSPLEPLPLEPLPVVVSTDPISSENRFLYHKTTRREWFQTRRSAHPDAFDVLLTNETGELTEFTIGNVVLELDEGLWTPPLTCGLLPGTFRGDLLARGVIRERILTRTDLQRCTRLWLINSVRGWVPVFVAH